MIFNKQFSAVDQELICGEWTSKLNGFLKYIRLLPIQYLCEWVSRGDCTRACLNQPNSFPDYIQSAFTYHKIFWDQIPQWKHIKTECGRGRIGPENYSLLFREKVARVEFVWNNISPCMGEYNEHMMGFACRVYCISLRNWKYL